MELIKKKIKRVLVKESVDCDEGTCYQLVPDLTTVYTIKFSLTSKVKDMGYFNSYVEE